ncbi:MAG: TspO/MBR family protein [Beijerinckiaceae bacterium]
MPTDENSSTRNALLAVVAVVVVFAAAALGSAASAPAIATWYGGLAKPFFTPPNWVFGPAWTTLYVLMAFAFWRVLRLPASTPGRYAGIVAFVAQLALNALWSVAFFAMRSPSSGLVVVLALWLAIAINIARFQTLDRIAAWCLAPYLAWVTFAAALNFGVWLMN